MANALTVLVAGRSWEWLRELCRPLGLHAQLVDQSLVALLPLDGPSAGFSLRDLIAGQKSALQGTVTATLQSRKAQVTALDSVDLVCAPLATEGRTLGALLVARPPRPAGPAAVSTGQLGTISAWLSGAVERHLTSAPAGPDNLSALHKVLQHIVHEGTDRELVGVFAEALAVWHDIEVVGYVERAPGVFVRAASLAGRVLPDRPIVFPPQSLPSELRMTRVPQADIDGLDAEGSREVLVTTLSRTTGNGTWMLTLAGGIDTCDLQVLGNYVSALDMAVALATAASRTRVAVMLSHRLSAPQGERGGGLEAALEALRDATGSAAAALAVESGARRSLFQVGSAEALPRAGDPPDRPRISVRHVLPGGQEATLSLARNDARFFTPLEHSMALVAAELLADWAVRPSPASAPEPAEANGALFGRTLEQLAGEALERGMAVTVVVISTATAPPAAWGQACVDELRRQMRQSDTVGLLQPGEVALLLPDTTAAHANAVARRLKAAAGASPAKAAMTAIGFATRMPGQGAAEGILRDARANAQRLNGRPPVGAH